MLTILAASVIFIEVVIGSGRGPSDYDALAALFVVAGIMSIAVFVITVMRMMDAKVHWSFLVASCLLPLTVWPILWFLGFFLKSKSLSGS
jgi:hypothetical protein